MFKKPTVNSIRESIKEQIDKLYDIQAEQQNRAEQCRVVITEMGAEIQRCETESARADELLDVITNL